MKKGKLFIMFTSFWLDIAYFKQGPMIGETNLCHIEPKNYQQAGAFGFSEPTGSSPGHP